MNYIDLFSGAGGFSKGFDFEGFKNVFSIDSDNQSCETYRYNFPKHELIEDSLENIAEKKIKLLIKNKKIDVILGGPPCQGFSMAGVMGRKFVNDPRNKLFKEFADFYGPSKNKTDRGILYVETVGYNQNNIDIIRFRRKILIKRKKHE